MGAKIKKKDIYYPLKIDIGRNLCFRAVNNSGLYRDFFKKVSFESVARTI